MRRTVQQFPNPGLSRWFHCSPTATAQAQRARPSIPNILHRPTPTKTAQKGEEQEQQVKTVPKHVKRNALGVQMLSRTIHEQVFKNCSFPSPPQMYTNIALEHLAAHELDPSQSSNLPSTEFTLPPLQGNNLLEHFYRIGTATADPYYDFAHTFAESELPPRPDNFDLQAGWTKYIYNKDGSSYSEHVAYPVHKGSPEEMLCFDVETLPNYHTYPIMACAASPNAWYVWISPWLLDPSSTSRNTSFLWALQRFLVSSLEYHVNGTQNRFLDTMALHVAVKGISSHQRPAWMKHRKNKEEDKQRREEAVEAIVTMLQDIQEQLNDMHKEAQDGTPADEEKRSQLTRLWQDLQESLPILQTSLESDTFTPGPPPSSAEESDEVDRKSWEDLTAMNSLVDVAKLYCNIDISKEIRGDFMTSTPEEILAGITDYLSYCASDVYVTHQVYKKVLPGFSSSCPHPVSFAGMLTMGSGFLPVNEQWEAYLEKAEAIWNRLEKGVKDGLESLARAAMASFKLDEPNQFDDDPWLSQLDWSPKAVGKTRGLSDPNSEAAVDDVAPKEEKSADPIWYSEVLADPLSKKSLERHLPLLLQLSYQGNPLLFTPKEKWHYMSPGDDGEPQVTRLPTSKKGMKTSTLLSSRHALILLNSGEMDSCDVELAKRVCAGEASPDVVVALAKSVLERGRTDEDAWSRQLDWKETDADVARTVPPRRSERPSPKSQSRRRFIGPSGFGIDETEEGHAPASMARLPRLSFARTRLDLPYSTPADGQPLDKFKHLKPLSFIDDADTKLTALLENGYTFYKLPHKDGETANVGSPLAKSFFGYASDGTLRSGAGEAAKEMVDVGVQCSYWVSARDRILNQMVGWQDLKGKKWDMGLPAEQDPATTADGELPTKWGMIIPQVITMGTVTRRAIEKTWLTASNAKKNRVGSELKAMVRAPPGYSLVGADVDSEELWISSCMGDAQFGLHGATAIGWMTLEGTKSAGTDLHSKTASILGISRDQAKVFNYSRIYGAGMRHAMTLLQQSNSNLLLEDAQKLAQNLYTSTKGKNTHRTEMFGRKFWYGGTESYVFNKLEEIALSDMPQTPALGCGVTHALSKANLPEGFGSDYMPSRINWVVQSSGVDYLHLLIVSMNHLITKYDIQARYLISVHDELRYLVKDEDRYRAVLALQIANLWTRSMFAYRLGMDDLPQGVAFFSAVDVDHVLRKEVDMPCVTPSQPNPIPPGESLNISQVLEKTNNGSLWADGRPMTTTTSGAWAKLAGYGEPDCLVHRAPNPAWLRAQATNDLGEIKHLAKQVKGKKQKKDVAEEKKSDYVRRKSSRRGAGIGNGEDVDWSEMIDQIYQSGHQLKLW
ncbi:hypothetical protein BDZ89DRAFT_1112456 [Hymenopellis radicata]|nr:hypothetical protein BDZ89DRAFT_1112456 [Hymenopellis radicata]